MFNAFKRSIPLHFDMLNATPYSLSKEENLIVGKSITKTKKEHSFALFFAFWT